MGKKKALVVGINEYEDTGFDQLKYAESDAKAIYSILVNPDIGDFPKEDVVLLTGKPKSEVEENLESILNEAKREDLVCIYFAGHGKLDKSANLCLAARNTKIDRLLATSIHLEHIRRIIDQSDCKRIVFIIDSCFSGAAGQSFRSGDVPSESFEQISGQGKVIISASQAFERARERDDIGHGIFTYNLVKGLEAGEADNDGDGYISVEELYKYISKNVEADTNGQQVPMKWGIDEKGEIVLAKSIKTLEKKRAEIERLSSNARELENQGRFDEAVDTWNRVLELDPKNNEAPLGINHAENEMKKREEIEAKVDRLFDLYKKGSVPGAIYNKAFGIIRNLQSFRSDQDKIFARLVEDLLSDNLSVENFVMSWNRIEKPEVDADAERPKQEMEEQGLGRDAVETETKDDDVRKEDRLIERGKKDKTERFKKREEVSPKKTVPVSERFEKSARILAGAGIVLLIIAALLVYKKFVPSVPSPEIAVFKADPTRIEKGASSVLEWSASNASEVEISGIGKVAPAGNQAVSPQEATTYTLIAKNEEGKTVQKAVTVEVDSQIPTEPPASNQILFQDNFSFLDPAWGVESSKLTVKDGKLIIQPEADKLWSAINQANLFEDMDARIKVRIANSNDLNWGGGLIFWAKGYNDYYYLLINGDGWFAVRRWVGGRSLDPVQWRASPSLKKGVGETNQLRLVTKGAEATVYINDTQVVTFKGTPPQGGGFIGVIGNAPSTWEFSDLTVMKP